MPRNRRPSRRNAFTIIEVMVACSMLVVALSMVFSLMSRGLRTFGTILTRMSAVQGATALRLQLKLDLAAAADGEVSWTAARLTIKRAGQVIVEYFSNGQNEVFRREGSAAARRVGSNLEAALSAEVRNDGQVRVTLKGAKQATMAYPLRTQNDRFARFAPVLVP